MLTRRTRPESCIDTGEVIKCSQVVICTGTFLGGEIHIGKTSCICNVSISVDIELLSAGMKRFPAGRIDEAPSVGLSGSLRSAGFQLGRLQTGTPARLLKDSIDFSKMDVQPGDAVPRPFSFMNRTVDNAVGCISCRNVPKFPTLSVEQSSRLLPDADLACYTTSHSRQPTSKLSHTGDEKG